MTGPTLTLPVIEAHGPANCRNRASGLDSNPTPAAKAAHANPGPKALPPKLPSHNPSFSHFLHSTATSNQVRIGGRAISLSHLPWGWLTDHPVPSMTSAAYGQHQGFTITVIDRQIFAAFGSPSPTSHQTCASVSFKHSRDLRPTHFHAHRLSAGLERYGSRPVSFCRCCCCLLQKES